MPLEIKPVEGYVAVQLLDVDDEESSSGGMMGAMPDDYNETSYALVVGVGPKAPAGVRKGATVLARRSELRNGVKISDDVRLISSWAIVAVAGS